jgi:Fe-S cluster biosynthesis and repair protein YggX
MSRMVYCEKYKAEKEGLDFPPFPGEVGQRIFNSISRQAWKDWIAHQTILINEYRLSSLDPKAKAFLAEEMDKFLFGEGSDLPDEFVPQA